MNQSGPSRQDPANGSARQAEREAEREAERRTLVHVGLISIGMILTFYIVNSLSIATELRWSGADRPSHYAWVQEGTAIIAMLIGLPLAMWMGHRFPVEAGRLKSSLPAHTGGVIAYAFIQISLMFAIRYVLWPGLYDRPYSIEGTWLEVYIYEFRKQLLAYIGFQMILSTDRALERARLETRAASREAKTRHRITLRCGGSIRMLEADGFERARAAGNYVETRFAGHDHLARMTLTELESLLIEAGIDAIRVHRSWLVNRDTIVEIVPTGEGDVTLTLSNGDQIPGSRRYRDRLNTT